MRFKPGVLRRGLGDSRNAGTKFREQRNFLLIEAKPVIGSEDP